jgi:hypothetical protein
MRQAGNTNSLNIVTIHFHLSENGHTPRMRPLTSKIDLNFTGQKDIY